MFIVTIPLFFILSALRRRVRLLVQLSSSSSPSLSSAYLQTPGSSQKTTLPQGYTFSKGTGVHKVPYNFIFFPTLIFYIFVFFPENSVPFPFPSLPGGKGLYTPLKKRTNPPALFPRMIAPGPPPRIVKIPPFSPIFTHLLNHHIFLNKWPDKSTTSYNMFDF